MNIDHGNFSNSSAFQDEIEILPAANETTATIFPVHRVRVAPHNSEWMNALRERFEKVVSLQRGWDGYVGVPVGFHTAQFAAQMIERLYVRDVPAPSIVPGSDGSLQVEWHDGGFDIELDVIAPLKVAAYRHNQRSGSEEELAVDSDFTLIAAWISEIAKARRDVKQLAG